MSENERRLIVMQRFDEVVRPLIKVKAEEIINEVFPDPADRMIALELPYQEESLACKFGAAILSESPYDGSWGQVSPGNARFGGIHQGNFQGNEINTAPFIGGVPNPDALPGWGHEFQAPSATGLPLTAAQKAAGFVRGAGDSWTNTHDPLNPTRPAGKYNVIKSLEFAYRRLSTTPTPPPAPREKRAHIVVLFCGESGGP